MKASPHLPSALAFVLLALSPRFASAVPTAVTKWVNLKPAEFRFENRPQQHSRPIVVGDIVYYATLNGDVYAVHRIQGNVLWRRKLPAGVDGAFSYGRSKLFVGDLSGTLYALEARNGEIVWTKKIDSQWLTPPVQVGARLLAIASSNELYALSERRGTELWHYSRRGDEKMTIRGSSSPVVFGADVYQGFADGFLVALALEDGKPRWEKRLRVRDRFYDVDATPYVDQNKIITGTYDGSLYSLERLTGDVQWRLPIGVYGGVLVDGDRMYFSGLDRHFYAVNAVTGKEIWKTRYDKGVGMTPVLVGGALVIPTSSGPIYLLDPESGKVLSSDSTGTGTMAPATAHQDGWFYVLSNYGQLYAMEVVDRAIRPSVVASTLSVPSALLRHQLGKDTRHPEPGP